MASENYHHLVELIGKVDDKKSVSAFIFKACKALAKTGYGNDFECIAKVRADYREWLEKRGLQIKYEGKTASNCFSMLKRSCLNGANLLDDNWLALSNPPNQNPSQNANGKKNIYIELNDLSIGIEISVLVTHEVDVAKYLLSKIKEYISGTSIYIEFHEDEFQKYSYYLDKNSQINKQLRQSLAQIKNVSPRPISEA